jgi:hypothetical protein
MFATTQSGVPALLAAERNTFIAPAITCRHVNDVSMPATYETPEQGSEQTREQTVEEFSEQTYQDISEEGHDEMFDQDPDYLSRHNKPGDMLFFPGRNILGVISRIDDTGISIGYVDFSINHEPGTWTLSGPEVIYTPFSEDANSFLAPGTLEKLLDADEEVYLVNRAGVVIRQEYFGNECPWWNCIDDGFFCPGCGGVSRTFDYLAMGCGNTMACPICHGHDFAEEDKGFLIELERSSGYERRLIWRERGAWINERRKALELSTVLWEDSEDDSHDAEMTDQEVEGEEAK